MVWGERGTEQVTGSGRFWLPCFTSPGAITDVVPRKQNTTNIYDILKDGWMALSHCFQELSLLGSCFWSVRQHLWNRQLFLAITWIACLSLFWRDDLKSDSHSLTGENRGKEHGNDREENFTENTVHQCSQEESKTNSQEAERSTTSESCDFDRKDVPTSKILSLSISSSSLSSSSSKTQEKADKKTEKAQVSLKVQRNECTKDLIVHSVRTVLQEWCTQSTLQFLGFSVQTEARSSFSVQGMSFVLKSLPSCSN